MLLVFTMFFFCITFLLLLHDFSGDVVGVPAPYVIGKFFRFFGQTFLLYFSFRPGVSSTQRYDLYEHTKMCVFCGFVGTNAHTTTLKRNSSEYYAIEKPSKQSCDCTEGDQKTSVWIWQGPHSESMLYKPITITTHQHFFKRRQIQLHKFELVAKELWCGFLYRVDIARQRSSPHGISLDGFTCL